MVKERYLINEAAKEVHVESHVLRYWEEELELPIKRNEQGHRIYTQEDVERFIRIKSLKDQGLQLKAVRAVLEQIQDDREESGEMRADNPFAQKQLTKIGKNGDMKVIQLKPNDESKWKELKSERHMIEVKEKKVSSVPRETMVHDSTAAEDNELAIQIKDMGTVEETKQETQLQDNQKEQVVRLQYLFQKLIKEAVAENNEALVETMTERISNSVKADLCKELDYQFRLVEEREDQRENAKKELDKQRDEEYYKRIDELLRQYSGKHSKPAKRQKLFQKKADTKLSAKIGANNRKNRYADSSVDHSADASTDISMDASIDAFTDSPSNGSVSGSTENLMDTSAGLSANTIMDKGKDCAKDNTVKFFKEKTEKKPKKEFHFLKIGRAHV